jgi:hypothetical protein
VVEHSLGKGEVESSILSRSTRFLKLRQGLGWWALPCPPRLDPEQGANVPQRVGENPGTTFSDCSDDRFALSGVAGAGIRKSLSGASVAHRVGGTAPAGRMTRDLPLHQGARALNVGKCVVHYRGDNVVRFNPKRGRMIRRRSEFVRLGRYRAQYDPATPPDQAGMGA